MSGSFQHTQAVRVEFQGQTPYRVNQNEAISVGMALHCDGCPHRPKFRKDKHLKTSV